MEENINEKNFLKHKKFKKLKFEIGMGIVCFFLSFTVTWQYRAVRKFGRATEQESAKINKLSEDYRQEMNKNLDLQKQVEILNEEIKKYRDDENSPGFSKVLNEELDKMEMDSGTIPVVGSGVIVILSEKKITIDPNADRDWYIVHDTTILDVLNELRAGGAEALSLNGERILATSEVRCVGPTVAVNGTRYCAPFEIKAIGNSNNLEMALKMPGGILEIWSPYIDITISKSENVKIDKFRGAIHYKHAKKDLQN